MQERNAGGREGGMKGGERAVKDNRVAAFISLWIYIWDGRTEKEREREDRTERWIQGKRDGI